MRKIKKASKWENIQMRMKKSKKESQILKGKFGSLKERKRLERKSKASIRGRNVFNWGGGGIRKMESIITLNP